VAFDFAALNAVRHSRNRQEPHAGPAATPAASSTAAKAAIVHRVIHKGVGVVVAAVAGCVDSGGCWKGGMPELGTKGNGVGLDIALGTAGTIFELVALWRGMKLGYVAPVVSGASDALLFYWAGKQGQLFGASKRKKDAEVTGSPTETGFNYALPDGRRGAAAASASSSTGQFAYDPLHGFAAQ
jgi:hypothetical protein